MNGRISGFASHGVNAREYAHIRNVVAVSNGGWGIKVRHRAVVVESTGSENVVGIGAADGSVVARNVAYGNSVDWIIASSGSSIVGNSSYDNGDDGIEAGTSCVVRDNAVWSNGDDGIDAENGSVVSDNATRDNTGNGITACLSLVRANAATNNGGYGLEFLCPGGSYRENLIEGNTMGIVNGSATNAGANVCNGSLTCP